MFHSRLPFSKTQTQTQTCQNFDNHQKSSFPKFSEVDTKEVCTILLFNEKLLKRKNRTKSSKLPTMWFWYFEKPRSVVNKFNTSIRISWHFGNKYYLIKKIYEEFGDLDGFSISIWVWKFVIRSSSRKEEHPRLRKKICWRIRSSSLSPGMALKMRWKLCKCRCLCRCTCGQNR